MRPKRIELLIILSVAGDLKCLYFNYGYDAADIG